MSEIVDEPTSEELNEYRKLLNNSFSNGISAFIPNSGKYHAAIMMSTMFHEAKQSVRMTVGNFCGEVSNNEDYLNSLKCCLDNGVLFSVLILEKPNNESQALELLIKYHKSNPTQVKLYQGNSETERIFNDNKLHFSVFDEKHFRLEIDPEKFGAIGGIEQADTAKKLVNFHTQYIELADLFKC